MIGYRKYPPCFESIYRKVAPITLIDKGRLFILYQLVLHVRDTNGGYAEVGVYKGGSAKLVHSTSVDNGGIFSKYQLYDTFEGMPETDLEKDRHRKGNFSNTDISTVSKLFDDDPNVRLIKGIFPESASPFHPLSSYSLVHIDCDIYQSVKDCCEFFYHRMVKGGVILFDDYGFPSCPGAKLAVDEFMRDRSSIIYLPTGQALVIR